MCTGDWLETAAAAIRGGAGCVQLREKTLPDEELLKRARQLRTLTAEHGVLMTINDRPDIARLARADVVHVGQGDLPVRDVRRIAGTGVLVGQEHAHAGAIRGGTGGGARLRRGRPRCSRARPSRRITSPAHKLWQKAAKITQSPLVAIGGITADNAAAIIQAGASCVCVCAGCHWGRGSRGSGRARLSTR